MEDPSVHDVLSCLQEVYLLEKDQIEDGVPVASILAKKEYKEKAKGLEQAIQKGRLKCKPFSYWAMTINMNGKSTGTGTANNRLTLLSIIIRNVVADVMFCQELPARFRELITDESAWGVVRKGNEAAVVWCKEDFAGSDEGLETISRRIWEKLARSAPAEVSELRLRVAMVKLTSRRTERCPERLKFLAASWHGPYRRYSEYQRKEVFDLLTQFLRKVSEKEGNIPFIIGGDFNLNTLDVALGDEMVVPNRELSPRDESRAKREPRYIPHKDNFIYLSKAGKLALSVEWSRSFDFVDNEELEVANDLSEEDQKNVHAMKAERGQATDVLDHDPVFGVLKLQQLDPVQNLMMKFEELSTSGTSGE